MIDTSASPRRRDGRGLIPAADGEKAMTRHVEITELLEAVPVSPAPMTRAAKLMHWASLVRNCRRDVFLLHGVEYMRPAELEITAVPMVAGHPTALALAASDPVFRAQGLSANPSIADALRFLGLTQHEAHAFSCDCHGPMSNEEQARRIENLA
jgi:hypothetical protein